MSDTQPTGVIESRSDFKKNPRGQYEYWCEEIKASQKARLRWHREGDRIVRRYVDYRRDQETDDTDRLATNRAFRLNLFYSNVYTLQSMLYGNLPKVDVSRRFKADFSDDVSRVAAEIMERILTNDIEDNGESYNSVLRACLQDRLLPGLGVARVRYEVETETVMLAEAERTGDEMGVTQLSEERVIREDAPIDYFFWRDVLWGWARTWHEIPWIGYRVWMTKDEVTARWGEDIAKELTYKKQTVNGEKDITDETDLGSVWQKAEIWEIWDKVERKVVFVSIGYDKVIETRDDPLQLANFYPSPPFFIANPTTTLFQPTPDWHMAADLYTSIDQLETRIAMITTAVKVVGVYDSSAEGVQRMFKEGYDNMLIPVSNWALFGEKGGLDGAVDWLPLGDIVNALDKLREMRNETIELLYQVTGMSDVLRGHGAGQYEGVGQAELKAKFGSVRVQKLQDEFAQFASDLMQLKAEVIARHFSPETIAELANIEESVDAELAAPAIDLIKRPEKAALRVVIKPESVAMVDYAQLKQERTDFITALATFMQSAAPLMEQDKAMTPFLLQLLQWGLSGFKGSQDIEGVIDKAVEQANQAMQQAQAQPDPQQMAAQMQMQMEQMKQQAKLAEIAAKAEADARTREFDRNADIETAMAQHQAKIAEIRAEMEAAIAETQAKLEADLMIEAAQAQANVAQTNAAAESEIAKDAINTELEVSKRVAETKLKIDEIAASTAGKITEAEIKTRQAKQEDDDDA